MSHVQPLLLLFASILFLPFSRAVAVNYFYCNTAGYDFGTVTGLEVEPSDQIFKITLSFVTSSTIKSTSLTPTLDVSLLYGGFNILQSSSLICSTGVCPLEPSKEYDINVSVISSSIVQDPKYSISLKDRLGDIREPEKLCVTFDLPTS
nr:PREDICTED: uncharacterized protein LOC108846974 [Raphanus sativus]